MPRTWNPSTRSSATRKHQGGAKPRKKSPAVEVQVHPKDLGSLFAKRPLIWGEAESDYDELLSKVTAAVKPTDIIETMWVKDVVDLIWESQRLRRLKVCLLTKASQRAVREVLMKIKDAESVDGGRVSNVGELIRAYFAGNKTAVAEIGEIVTSYGLDADSFTSQVFSDRLDEMERIERLIASADARRNKALSEIERRRDMFAYRLRLAAHDVTDIKQPNVELSENRT